MKKQLLALAVVALSSGAAFADNEAAISQDGTTDSALAIIEQIGSQQGALTDNYGQIIQQAAVSDTNSPTSAIVFQGTVDTQTGSFTPSAGGSITTTSVLAGNVNLPVDNIVDGAGTGYTPSGQAMTNVGIAAQYATNGGNATIVQTGGSDVINAFIDYSQTAVPVTGVGTAVASNAGVASQTTTVDVTSGALTYTDSFLSTGTNGLLTLGAGVGTGLNDNEVAVIDQGDVPVDRLGNDLSQGAFSVGTGTFDDQAQVLQAGQNQSAVIYQSGDAQIASIYQDGTLNDAWIAQFGNAGAGVSSTAGSFAAVVQLATGDSATIYQGGTNNTAYILQH